MDSDITEEELDVFLKEVGILKTEETIYQETPPERQESLDTLLEEIIGAARPAPTPVSPIEEKIPPFLFDKEKPKSLRLRFLPLALSIAFLGGIFLGTIFGFFWGRREEALILPLLKSSTPS